MIIHPIAEPILDAEERFEGFDNLMPFRVQNILLVSSLYDSFILREDGRLNELLIDESLELNLQQIPGITHVSSCAEALELARSQPRFNLIVTNLAVGDMNAAELAREVREAGLDVPVVVLGIRLSRDQELRRPQSGHRYRSNFSLAGNCAHPDRDRQIHRRQAQRAARHARHGRSGPAGGGRQHPLLLVVSAGDLHRADQAVAARDSGRHQRRAQAGAHASASEDPAVLELRRSR